MTELRVAFGEITTRAFREPFGDGGGGSKRVDFTRVSFLDLHDDEVVAVSMLMC